MHTIVVKYVYKPDTVMHANLNFPAVAANVMQAGLVKKEKEIKSEQRWFGC